MKVTINLNGVDHEIDLTPEQIEKIQIDSLITTWKQAFEREQPMFYLNSSGVIYSYPGNVFSGKTNVPSKKHAKSILALSQLYVIVESLNKTDTKKIPIYTVCYCTNKKNLIISKSIYALHSPLQLYSEKLAQHLITHFPQLLKDFYMVD